MNNNDAYEQSWATARRNEDHNRVYDDLIERVAESIDFDEQAERLGKAKRIVAARMRPGTTAAQGQVVIPGLEPYGYEPRRLLADAEGNVTENRHATPRFKQAEADRAEDAARRAGVRAEREIREAELFAAWVEREVAKGRPRGELTWDVCVRETGLWKDETPDGGDRL